VSRRTKVALGLLIWPLGIYWALMARRTGRNASIAIASIGGLFLLIIVIAIASSAGGGGGSDNSASPSATATTKPSDPPPPPPPAPPPPPPPSEPEKASNGDDAKDLHNRAQQAVNRAEVCLVAIQLAARDTSSPVSMASSLQKARSICEESKTALATDNGHGFSDQATELFASADAGKSATNAGLAYLDTLAPSKLADFQRHVEDASGYFEQGLKDLNARLNELGVARVKG
jgi:hypothetical protein